MNKADSMPVLLIECMSTQVSSRHSMQEPVELLETNLAREFTTLSWHSKEPFRIARPSPLPPYFQDLHNRKGLLLS